MSLPEQKEKIVNNVFFLRELYDRHYLNQSSSSSMTSSHWEKYGDNSVQYDDELVLGRGEGFGDYVSREWKEYFTFLVPSVLLFFYLKKYVKNKKYIQFAKQIVRKTNRRLSFDCCKQIVAIERILYQINNKSTPRPFSDNGVKTIAIIGDGYGYLGSLIKKIDSEVKVISVNLGRQLLYDASFTYQVYNDSVKYDLIKNVDKKKIASDFTFLEAENASLLPSFKIDLFINIASMQEMNNDVIGHYFKLMRECKKINDRVLFYSINRLEKRLPDGEVTKAKNYPWDDSKMIFDSIPAWYSHFPKSKPPFWKRFDGPMYERFVEL